jgi:hypothetical protein
MILFLLICIAKISAGCLTDPTATVANLAGTLGSNDKCQGVCEGRAGWINNHISFNN